MGWICPKKKNVKNETNFKQATVLLASDTSWKCGLLHPGPGYVPPFELVSNFHVVYKERALAALML